MGPEIGKLSMAKTDAKPPSQPHSLWPSTPSLRDGLYLISCSLNPVFSASCTRHFLHLSVVENVCPAHADFSSSLFTPLAETVGLADSKCRFPRERVLWHIHLAMPTGWGGREMLPLFAWSEALKLARQSRSWCLLEFPYAVQGESVTRGRGHTQEFPQALTPSPQTQKHKLQKRKEETEPVDPKHGL